MTGLAEKEQASGPSLKTDLARVGITTVARAALKTTRLVRRADLVYERFGTLATLGDASRRPNIPWVLESNGLFFEEAAKDRGSLRLVEQARRHELAAYAECDLLVAVSDGLAASIRGQAPALAEKILVLPNGVTGELALIPPHGFRKRKRDGAWHVGWAGTMVPWHGLADLISAIGIAKQRGTRVHLSLIGTGPQEESLRDLASSRGVSEQVNFLGRMPQKAALGYLASHCDVGYAGHLPLASSGSMYHSPLKVYEYAAVGLPVLAAEGIPAAVNIPAAFIPFPAGDAESLAKIMVEEAVASSMHQFADQASKGRNAVLAQHTWNSRVAVLLNELRERGLLGD